MSTFQQAFIPAVNKDGYSRLTFLGLDRKSGTSLVKDKEGNAIVDTETGELKTKEWVINNLTFEVMGRVKGTSQKVSVTVGERYSEDNLLGKTLSAMGFIAPQVEVVEDEDGFEVEVLPEDEDGFGVVEGDVLGEALEVFISNAVNRTYIAKLTKLTEGKRKGFWNIEVETLQPFSK